MIIEFNYQMCCSFSFIKKRINKKATFTINIESFAELFGKLSETNYHLERVIFQLHALTGYLFTTLSFLTVIN